MADLPGIDQDLTFSKEIAAQMLEYKAYRYCLKYFSFFSSSTMVGACKQVQAGPCLDHTQTLKQRVDKSSCV